VESLAEAIKHDIRELSISMEFNEFRFHSWQYLLRMSGIDTETFRDMPRPENFIVHVWDRPYPDEINQDFIAASVRELNHAFIGMEFNYSAINEINNLGILSDIKDDSLKMAINEYNQTSEFERFRRAFVREAAESVPAAMELNQVCRIQADCKYKPWVSNPLHSLQDSQSGSERPYLLYV